MVHTIRNNSTVKVKHIYLYISYIPRGLLRGIKTHVHIKNCIRTFIAVLFIIAKNEVKYSSIIERANKLLLFTHNIILLLYTKEWTTDIANTRDESQKP